MISSRYHRVIQIQMKRLQKHATKIWFIPFISILAFVDNFVIVIPSEGILISSSILVPKKWFWFAIFMGLCSSLGALLLAYFVQQMGLPIILDYFPGIDHSQIWSQSKIFFDKYGLLFIFVLGITPLMQHPAIILAALAKTPLLSLGAAIILGRGLKYIFLAFIASHAPKFLNRLWKVKNIIDIKL